MLALGTRIKLVAFVLLAVAVLAFTAVRYASLGRYLGLSGYYTVKLELPNAGGLFSSADVTYRGVSVGRVGTMSLTPDGIVADLNISNSAPKIPSSGLQATVADLSAVGEEYVNLRPQTSSGPYLAAGSVIPQRRTQVPPPITSVLASVNALVTSVPRQSLRTVVAELGHAFAGQGPNLQVLLDSSSTLTRAAAEHVPQTSRLIADGRTVLATQAADTAAIEAFGRNAALLAGQLARSDPDLRSLIAATPRAAVQVTGLLRDSGVSLGAVIANLLTTSNVTLTRQPALKEMLSGLPAAIAAGSTVINSHGANFGMALTFFNPLHGRIRRHRVPQRTEPFPRAAAEHRGEVHPARQQRGERPRFGARAVGRRRASGRAGRRKARAGHWRGRATVGGAGHEPAARADALSPIADRW
jgi:phospholipid/cholesterol/gamma-HCH transport system substrate-binding protein